MIPLSLISNGRRGNVRSKGTPIVIAWYRPEQWSLLKAYSVDKDVIEDTFEEWAEHAKKQFEGLQNSGMNMHKILIDIDALVTWCKERDVPMNSESRSQYAAESMREINS